MSAIKDRKEKKQNEAWKAGRFEELGFSKETAIVLAHTETDQYHVIKKALEQGCSHELAERIFI